jgi:hypothetical protein
MALNLSLDIDFELADKITVANLQESYRRIGEDIERLEKLEVREPWQQEDYEQFKKYRKAIKKVLRYFMVYNEAEEFFNAE